MKVQQNIKIIKLKINKWKNVKFILMENENHQRYTEKK